MNLGEAITQVSQEAATAGLRIGGDALMVTAALLVVAERLWEITLEEETKP